MTMRVSQNNTYFLYFFEFIYKYIYGALQSIMYVRIVL